MCVANLPARRNEGNPAAPHMTTAGLTVLVRPAVGKGLAQGTQENCRHRVVQERVTRPEGPAPVTGLLVELRG